MSGNHYDAWMFGATDALSGTVTLMETSRAFSELMKTGLKLRPMILIDWLVVPESQFLAHITVMTAKWCVYNLDLIAIHSFFEINWASWPRKRESPINRKSSNQSKSKIGLRLAAYHPVNQTFSIKQQYFNRFLYRIYSTPNHDVPADHHCSLGRSPLQVPSTTDKSSSTFDWNPLWLD